MAEDLCAEIVEAEEKPLSVGWWHAEGGFVVVD